MKERKQTPDVLAEILAGEVTEANLAELSSRRPAGRPVEARKWEYLIVSFQYHRDAWRPRYVNGEELADWTSGPVIHDYASQLGEEGWELVSASAGDRLYGTADRYQMFFKQCK